MKTNNKITDLNAPDAGKIITAYFKQKRIRKSALSRNMNINLSTLNIYTKNQSIKTTALWSLCMALKHNFFAEYAAALPESFSSTVISDTTKDEIIKQLELEIQILKAEKAVLISVMKP
jgi:hypothetical protein